MRFIELPYKWRNGQSAALTKLLKKHGMEITHEDIHDYLQNASMRHVKKEMSKVIDHVGPQNFYLDSFHRVYDFFLSEHTNSTMRWLTIAIAVMTFIMTIGTFF